MLLSLSEWHWLDAWKRIWFDVWERRWFDVWEVTLKQYLVLTTLRVKKFFFGESNHHYQHHNKTILDFDCTYLLYLCFHLFIHFENNEISYTFFIHSLCPYSELPCSTISTVFSFKIIIQLWINEFVSRKKFVG